MNNEKRCKRCGDSKNNTEFRKDARGKDGFRSECKQCERNKRNDNLTLNDRKNRTDGISKKCVLCNQILAGINFHIDNSRTDGLSQKCKECKKTERAIGKRKRDEIPKELNNMNSGLVECKECKTKKTVNEFRKSGRGFTLKCKICLKKYEKERRNKLKSSRSINPPNVTVDNLDFNLKKTAVNKYFKVYEYKNKDEDPDKSVYFDQLETKLRRFLTDLTKTIPMKVSFEADYTFLNKNNDMFIIPKRTDKEVIISKNDIDKLLPEVMSKFTDGIYEGHFENSGLALLNVKDFRMYTNPFIISAGSSYVELPQKIKGTKACINITNRKDNKCLLWCLIAHFHRVPIGNPCKLYNYNKVDFIKEFDMSGISFPTPINEIPAVERQNNLSINLYLLSEVLDSEGNLIYPISLIYPASDSRDLIEGRHINVLLYKGHFILIVNTKRLFSSCVRGRHSSYMCDYCGTCIFTTESALKRHSVACKHKFKEQKFTVPGKDKTVTKFKNFSNMIETPFIIYADFESYFLEPKRTNTNKTKYEKVHKPMAFAFKTVCRDDPLMGNDMNVYIGDSADKKFTEEVVNEALRINCLLNTKKDIIISQKELRMYEQTTLCFICGESFCQFDINKKKVMDHNHLTGKFRGAAHSDCNMHYTRKNLSIPVVFHNLEGYDLHLFVDALSERGKEFSIIPKSKEKYISLIMKIDDCQVKLKFIDSLHFFTGSLAENAKRLSDFRFLNEEQKLLRFKQYFPYSYFTSLDVLNEKQLPSNKAAWFNELKNEDIKDEELEHAQMIFKKFKCNDLRDYTKLYLTTDVLLLAEIFEKFRDLSMSTYQLDPASYFTTPGFAWDAALKQTKVELEVLKDKEMIEFFIEKGTMRGGISTVCRKKEATANNPYMKDFDHTKKTTYIIYLDVTNLYGHTMTGMLPIDGFNWLSLDLVDYYGKNISELFESIGSETGYILEVDLIYPRELRDEHIELPMAPEHFKGKLSPNLHSKYHYRTRIENLKYYLDSGLTLSKIHRILTFRQKGWLKEYIDNNTELRKNSTDDIAKNYYKLMNNAVFGKTMENVFNRKNFKLIGKKNIDQVIKHTRNIKFKAEHILSENLVLLEFEKEEIVFDKPIYVGFTILELSKLHMYKLHYDLIKNKFGNKATLMYMDTDSLVYEVETNDVYDDLKDIKGNFDMSVYPKEFKCYDDVNKGVLGTLKDEFASFSINGNTIVNCITDFSCLRSKSYSLKTLREQEVKKCKGVCKTELNKLSHNDFVGCNKNGEVIEVAQVTFKTINHEIYTVVSRKDGISRFDDKRQIDDRMGIPPIYTVPWGYNKERDED